MNKRIKAKWVKALRSGKYEQGKSCLCDYEKKMCCLGVLCDLYLKEKKGIWQLSFDGSYECNHEAYVLPKEVMKWAELPKQNPYIGYYLMSVYNDKLGMSFKQIANLIEKSKEL